MTPPQAFATPLEEKHQIINEETFIPPPPPLLPSPPPYIYSDIKSFNLNIAATTVANNHLNAIQNDHSPPSFSSSSSCSSSSSPSSSSSSASAQSSSSSSCNFSHSQTNKNNSTSRALSPSHLLARPLPPAPLQPPTQFTHNDKQHLLTEISKITDVTPTRPNNLTSKSKSPRPPHLDQQSNVVLKNTNKNNNQFLLNNSHFVVSDAANNQHNQNYTNVTIWREELNAKNNVQQQIKKQVG